MYPGPNTPIYLRITDRAFVYCPFQFVLLYAAVLTSKTKREQLFKLPKSQRGWSALPLLPFYDSCHLRIFLAEQDFIQITFSLGPKIGRFEINADCISTASSPEPIPAIPFIPRSHYKFCRTWRFPVGFITGVFKRDPLIFLPPVDVLLVNPGHEKRK